MTIIFAIGDDYEKIFPKMDEYKYVNELCEVRYLKRTPDISSQEIKTKLARQLNVIKKM